MYVVQLPIIVIVASGRFRNERLEAIPGPRGMSALSSVDLSGASIILRLWTATKLRYRLLSLIFRVDWLLFALALTLIQPAVATIVVEFWPIMFVLLNLVFDPSKDKSKSRIKNHAGPVVLMILGALAVAMVIISEQGAIERANFLNLGVGVAILSGLAGALAGFVQKRGGEARNLRNQSLVQWAKYSSTNTALVSTSLSAVSKLVIGSFLLIVMVIVGGFQVIRVGSILLALVAGIADIFGSLLFYTSIHLSGSGDKSHSRSGAITSLYYCVPILALGWLWLFSRVEVSRADLLLAGAVGVIVINMIMHLDPEGVQGRALGATAGHGYRAIVLSLWICGVIVAFREDWMPEVWVQSSVVEYWGIVGVCATVFVLIMSFRQSRLNERRTLMDEMTLRLHAKVSELAAAGSLRDGGEIALRLRELDTETRPARISKIYLEMRSLIRPQLMEARRAGKELAERASSLGMLMADINVLTNLRQQGRNFAELAVMTLFASLTVLLALFVRPEGNAVPFSGFVNDVVTMVLAAAFAFLVFDLVDKRREADAPLIQEAEPTEGTANSTDDTDALHDWHLALHSRSDPTVDRWISSLLGVAVVVVFVFILYFKWLVV